MNTKRGGRGACQVLGAAGVNAEEVVGVEALCGARSVDYVVEVVARELSLKIVGVVKIKLDEVYPAVCEILPRAALAYRRPCLEAPP